MHSAFTQKRNALKPMQICKKRSAKRNRKKRREFGGSLAAQTFHKRKRGKTGKNTEK
jgi:hypothetical protein